MSTASDKVIPAYIPWETFTTFIAHLKATAVPTRIDKSVMPTGTAALTSGQIQSALKFFRLTDSAGKTNDSLSAVVAAYETDKWGDAVREMTQEPYGEIVGDLDINTATPHQLDEKFKNVGVNGQMLQKSLRFYLAALTAAGTTFSPHLIGRRKRSNAARKRPSTTKTPVSQPHVKETAPNNPKDENTKEPDAPGTQRYPLYFKGKATGALVVPSNLTAADCKVIQLQLAVLEAYAANERSE